MKTPKSPQMKMPKAGQLGKIKMLKDPTKMSGMGNMTKDWSKMHSIIFGSKGKKGMM